MMSFCNCLVKHNLIRGLSVNHIKIKLFTILLLRLELYESVRASLPNYAKVCVSMLIKPVLLVDINRNFGT